MRISPFEEYLPSLREEMAQQFREEYDNNWEDLFVEEPSELVYDNTGNILGTRPL